MEFRVDIWHDGKWVDMLSLKTRAEAESLVATWEEDDKYRSLVYGMDVRSEYRIVEVTK